MLRPNPTVAAEKTVGKGHITAWGVTPSRLGLDSDEKRTFRRNIGTGTQLTARLDHGRPNLTDHFLRILTMHPTRRTRHDSLQELGGFGEHRLTGTPRGGESSDLFNCHSYTFRSVPRPSGEVTPESVAHLSSDCVVDRKISDEGTGIISNRNLTHNDTYRPRSRRLFHEIGFIDFNDRTRR